MPLSNPLERPPRIIRSYNAKSLHTGYFILDDNPVMWVALKSLKPLKKAPRHAQQEILGDDEAYNS